MADNPKLVRSVAQLLGSALSQNNHLDVLKNGDEIFPAMLEAIRSAGRTIEFSTYVYWGGEIAKTFAQALIDAADRDVEVRVLIDAHGGNRMAPEVKRLFEESRCKICWFRPFHWWLPFNNHRTHRKLLICDNSVGFTGGVGIADEWTGDAAGPGQWRETHFRIKGELVRDLRAAFLDNWLEHHPTDVPAGMGHRIQSGRGDVTAGLVASVANNRWSRMATLLHGILALAEESVDICTPYFVPDRHLTRALVAAADRGVKVRILTASAQHIDSRMSYLAGARYVPKLLRSGIAIYQYRRTFLHAKVMVVDGAVAVAGSSNINQRSLKKDDEASVVCASERVGAELIRHFEDDLRYARRVSMGRFRRRGWISRLGELLVRPFSESV